MTLWDLIEGINVERCAICEERVLCKGKAQCFKEYCAEILNEKLKGGRRE